MIDVMRDDLFCRNIVTPFPVRHEEPPISALGVGIDGLGIDRDRLHGPPVPWSLLVSTVNTSEVKFTIP
jgi:hypothetical protein